MEKGGVHPIKGGIWRGEVTRQIVWGSSERENRKRRGLWYRPACVNYGNRGFGAYQEVTTGKVKGRRKNGGSSSKSEVCPNHRRTGFTPAKSKGENVTNN